MLEATLFWGKGPKCNQGRGKKMEKSFPGILRAKGGRDYRWELGGKSKEKLRLGGESSPVEGEKGIQSERSSIMQ